MMRRNENWRDNLPDEAQYASNTPYQLLLELVAPQNQDKAKELIETIIQESLYAQEYYLDLGGEG